MNFAAATCQFYRQNNRMSRHVADARHRARCPLYMGTATCHSVASRTHILLGLTSFMMGIVYMGDAGAVGSTGVYLM
eukprot:COSAG01_NODE_23032_length_831_cov_0.762295_1_plen_76_part_10